LSFTDVALTTGHEIAHHRPVGTTIYPGLQVTAWAIHFVLNQVFKYPISINDVCVYIPAWFSVLTCLAVFGMTYEASKSANAGVAAAAIMAIVPSHIMRSVAGGYDNESIAMAAMCVTFFLWMRTLRSAQSWPLGLLTGLSYVYMVAAWGGYIFVLNMIGLHAMFILIYNCFLRVLDQMEPPNSSPISSTYSAQLHLGYSLFYIVGTLGAIQFPVVGYA
jgi:dolichyl-diphosphooligosaccharide--protein glycosyltransferase